jgi:acetyl-CoA carboxylase biotin carboxyl carrier protein
VSPDGALDEIELRRLVRDFVVSGVQHLSLEVGHLTVAIDKHVRADPALPEAAAGSDAATLPHSRPPSTQDAGGTGGATAALVEVRSPVVGILQWLPGGGRSTAIDVGDPVGADEEVASIDVLGKRVPVVSPVAGSVAEVAVEDGAFVEYGEVLIRLTPTR